MSKLDEMIEQAEMDAALELLGRTTPMSSAEFACFDQGCNSMATLLRSDTAFRALCEERLERLEAEREELATDLACDAQEGATVNTDCLHRADHQIAALRTLLEG